MAAQALDDVAAQFDGLAAELNEAGEDSLMMLVGAVLFVGGIVWIGQQLDKRQREHQRILEELQEEKELKRKMADAEAKFQDKPEGKSSSSSELLGVQDDLFAAHFDQDRKLS